MEHGNEPLIGVEELAERLQVKPSWIYVHAAAGKIPSIKLGKYLRFEPSAHDLARAALEADVSTESVGVAYKLLPVQVRAVVSEMKDEQDVLDRLDRAHQEAERSVDDFGKTMKEAFGGGVNVARDLGVAMGDIQLGSHRLFMSIDQDTKGIIGLAPDMTKVYVRPLRDQLLPTLEEWQKQLEDLSSSFARLAQVSGGSFSEFARWAGQVTAALELTSKATSTWKNGLANLKLGNEARGFQELAVSALDMAGAFLQATSSTSKLQATLGGAAVGSQIGGAIGSIFGPGGAAIGKAIGAAAGALTGFFRSLFGGASQAELEGRKLEAQFEKTFGSFDKMVSGIGAAYLPSGRTLEQARSDVASLLAAEKDGPEATQHWIDTINQAFADQKKNEALVGTGVDDLTAAWQNAGEFIPKAITDAINKLLTMNGLTDAQRGILQGMVDAAAPNYDKLTKMADTYGISLSMLGPKFQQANIEGRAAQIFKDFSALTEAGGDVNGILSGMSDEINAVVHDSLKFGTAIPENMKPLIQKLIDWGQLTDDNGAKITDISKIKFEDTPLDKGLDKLNKAIDHLADVLSKLPGLAQAAANGIPGNPFEGWQPPAFDPSKYDPSNYNFTPPGGQQSAQPTTQQATKPAATVLPFVPKTAAQAVASTAPKASSAVIQFPTWFKPSVASGKVALPKTTGAAKPTAVVLPKWFKATTALKMATAGSVTMPKVLKAKAGALSSGVVNNNISIVVNAEGALFDTPAGRQKLAQQVGDALMQNLRQRTRFNVA